MIEDRNMEEHIKDYCNVCADSTSWPADDIAARRRLYKDAENVMELAFESEIRKMSEGERRFWRLLFLKYENPKAFERTIGDLEKKADAENKELLTAIRQTTVSRAEFYMMMATRMVAPDKFDEIINNTADEA